MEERIHEYGGEFDLASNNKYRNFLADRSLIIASDFFRSGRDALRAIALKQKSLRNRILLPALCCRPMLQPFEDNGFSVAFYKLKQDLTIDFEDVLLKLKPDDLFLYMNYFGIQMLSDELLETIHKQYPTVIMIEDRTHDYFHTRSNQFKPDYSVASLRKWLAIPDGAILSSKDNSITFEKKDEPFYSEFRMDMMISKSEFLKSGHPKVKQLVLSLAATADDYLEHDLQVIGMSARAYTIIYGIDFKKMLEVRIENSMGLSDQLSRFDKVQTLPGFQPDEPAIYYPIVVKDRDKLRSRLADHGVQCPIVWPLPAKASGVCSVCDDISSHILALPCDHRYDTSDMVNISEIVGLVLQEI